MKDHLSVHASSGERWTSITCAVFLLIGALIDLPAQTPPGTVLWTYSTTSPILVSPALAPDGTVYIAAPNLIAVTNSGGTASNKWVSAHTLSGEPAIGADGTIYFCSASTTYALNPDGSQKWSFPVGSPYASPAISLDNSIYTAVVGGGGGLLQSISSLGLSRWQWTDPDPATGNGGLVSPAVGQDGRICLCFGGIMCAVTPLGSNLWTFTFPRQIGAGDNSPAIAADGTIFAAVGALYAFTSTGSVLWTVGNASAGLVGSPVIANNGTVYVSTQSPPGRLQAISPSGQVAWQVSLGASETNGPSPRSPAVDAGGMIYYCTSNSVWALNPQGQVQWKVTSSGPLGYEQSPIIGPDGTLYAALGQTLYAIATGTNGPANSPWPMERQNARHTGKVERPTLGQPQRRSDANFQFQLYGQLGQTYTIQSSTDLAAWTSFTSIVATTLPTPVADLTATNAPWRLYRASSPP